MKTKEKIIRGYATQISEEVIEAINMPGGFDNIESAVESSLDEMYEEIKPKWEFVPIKDPGPTEKIKGNKTNEEAVQ